ncbi:MAG: hypothetical protein MPJ24_07145, partial [Pirellulaceae bacterium]|nr:hypothetical protein [Pirellulaceae bacterium]
MASRLFRFLHGGHFRLGAPVCLAPIDLGSLGSATEGLDPSHEAVSVLGTPAEGVLSTAPYEVVRRFVKRALERQVAFVIISGKSFDSNEISLASVEFLGEQFRRLVEGKIQVFWAPTDDIVDEYRESFETLFHGVNLLPPDEAQKTIIRVKGEPVDDLYGSCSSAITLGDLAKFA